MDVHQKKTTSRKKNAVGSCELPLTMIPQEVKECDISPKFRLIVTDHSSEDYGNLISPEVSFEQVIISPVCYALTPECQFCPFKLCSKKNNFSKFQFIMG